MGQESSLLVDETTPPSTLKSRDLNGVADYIKSGKVKKIVVMVRITTHPLELYTLPRSTN
jgi:hypothetical protein